MKAESLHRGPAGVLIAPRAVGDPVTAKVLAGVPSGDSGVNWGAIGDPITENVGIGVVVGGIVGLGAARAV
jgi:hypothetical protein